MADVTLADVNATLSEQNKILDTTSKGIGNVSSNLKAFIDGMKSAAGDQLEADIEARSKQKDKESRVKTKPSESSKKGLFGGFFDDLLGSLPGGFGIGAGIGLIGALGAALLKRGIPALLANVFADEIADFIEKETGSEALGDAVFRALKLGSFGLLLGKRFALFGAVIGAILTEDNRAKLSELGENLKLVGEDIASFFNVTLPDFEGILKFISETVGGGIDFLNASLKGEFDSEAFKENWDEALLTIGGIATLSKTLRGAILKSFKLVAGAIGSAVAAVTGLGKIKPPPIPGADGPIAKFDQTKANTEAAKNLSKRQAAKLEKQGFKVNKAGGITDLKGKVVSPQKAAEALKRSGVKVATPATVAKAASKFPRFSKFLGFARSIPGLGALIAGGTVASILMDDSLTDADKAIAIGGAIGGLGGGVLGGLLGATVGGPVGLTVGGIAGYLGGDILGQALGEYLTGNKVTAFPLDSINDMINNNIGETAAQQLGAKSPGVQVEITPTPKSQADFTAPTSSTGFKLNEQIEEMPSASAPTIIMDNSNRSQVSGGTTNQSMMIPPASVYDKYDYMDGTRN